MASRLHFKHLEKEKINPRAIMFMWWTIVMPKDGNLKMMCDYEWANVDSVYSEWG